MEMEENDLSEDVPGVINRLSRSIRRQTEET